MRVVYIAGAPLSPTPSERVVETTLHAPSWGLLSRAGERRWVMGFPGESMGDVNTPSLSLDLGDIVKRCTTDVCRSLTAAIGTCGAPVPVGTSLVSVSRTHTDDSS